MKLLTIDIDKSIKHIDLDPVIFYDKALRFVRKKYRPYEDKERQQLAAAAPLIKFSMARDMRILELDILENLLSMAYAVGATCAAINDRSVTFFIKDATLAQVFNRSVIEGYIERAFSIEKRNVVPWQHTSSGSRICKMHIAYGLLPCDSEVIGIYNFHNRVHNKVSYEMYTKRKECYDFLYNNGWVAEPGTPPTPTTRADNQCIREAYDALRFCQTTRPGNEWRDMLLMKLRTFQREFRWKDRDVFRAKLESEAVRKV